MLLGGDLIVIHRMSWIVAGQCMRMCFVGSEVRVVWVTNGWSFVCMSRNVFARVGCRPVYCCGSYVRIPRWTGATPWMMMCGLCRSSRVGWSRICRWDGWVCQGYVQHVRRLVGSRLRWLVCQLGQFSQGLRGLKSGWRITWIKHYLNVDTVMKISVRISE